MLIYKSYTRGINEDARILLPLQKCSIYEKQNQIPENLAMPQTASEGCKCNELKPEGNYSQCQASDVTLATTSD